MRVVGIGMSSEGMEALSELLAHLSPETGATFVIAHHLAPDQERQLPAFIQETTSLTVQLVSQATDLEPDHIYIISQEQLMLLEDGRLVPATDLSDHQRIYPVDMMFESLSRYAHTQAIGLLLSGIDTDGLRGIRYIKEAGGLVLLQAADSGRFDTLTPAIVRLRLADQMASPRELAHTLNYVLSPLPLSADPSAVIEGWINEEVQPFFELILDRVSSSTHVDFSHYDKKVLGQRLVKRMSLLRFEGIEKYCKFLLNNKPEVQALYYDFLIGVTHFFRNSKALEKVTAKVLPAIFGEESRNKTVRIWVPTCSTGEEVYTLAILVDQYLEKFKLTRDYKIFGTDVDHNAIRTATEGVYPQSIIADIPSVLVDQYFKREGGMFRIRPEMRDRILFAVQNVLADPPFIRMDFICCRQALRYFNQPTQQMILSTFHFALNDEAYLMLSEEEPVIEGLHVYNKVSVEAGIYQKSRNTRLPVGTRINTRLRAAKRGNINNAFPDLTQQRSVRNYQTTQERDPFSDYLVRHFAPFSLFLTVKLDLVYSNGAIDQLFELPQALARLNIGKMVPQEVTIVFQNGVKRALESEHPITYSDVVFEKRGNRLNTQLQFEKAKIPNLEEELVLVEISPKQQQAEQSDTQDEIDSGALRNDHIAHLHRQIEESRRRAQMLVNELEATNEELQASNRELLAANEELQSTNEELQSVNEELYTVNRELQVKNEALSIANNDINNLLRSTQIGTIFLDAQLKIRKFTPAIRRQFDLLDTDIGRPITHFAGNFDGLDIGRTCSRVYETLESFEQEITDNAGDHYLLRILPYRTQSDVIEGLVVAFINVGELVSTREQVDQLANQFRSIFQHSSSYIMVLDPDATIRRANRSFGYYTTNQLEDRSIFEVIPSPENEELKKVFEEMMQSRRAQHCRLSPALQRDSPRQLEVRLIPVTNWEGMKGRIHTVLVLIKDISEALDIQQDLEEAVREYKAFMDLAKDQIILIDENGLVKYVNYIQHPLLKKEELIGENLYEYLAAEHRDSISEAVSRIFQGQPSRQIKLEAELPGFSNRVRLKLINTPVILDGGLRYTALIVKPEAEDQSVGWLPMVKPEQQ